MDPLTHGLAGAIATQTFATKAKMRPAVATGFLAALLADADIFIFSGSDPLLNVEIHRQFTHSLAFIPIGAFIATILLWLVMKRYLTAKDIFLFSLAGYATSGLLDACTSYGTQLLWPFLDTRYSWNLVSVVDPILTTGLLLLTARALYKQNRTMIWLAWGWLFVILLNGWVQHNRAETKMFDLANQRGHEIHQLVVKPTIGNQILWRGTYQYQNRIQTDAVRTGFLSSVKVYEGESAPVIAVEQDYSEFEGTTLYADLKRFEKLSEGYLIRHPDDPEVIGDARYSMLPTSLVPLWGVETDTSNTDEHLPFLYFRDANEEARQTFINMLAGE